MGIYSNGTGYEHLDHAAGPHQIFILRPTRHKGQQTAFAFLAPSS